MVNKFCMHKTRMAGNEVIDKSTESHDTYDSAKQSMHAYLGAYGYGHEKNITFVQAFITDKTTHQPLMGETWNAPEPEPVPEQ